LTDVGGKLDFFLQGEFGEAEFDGGHGLVCFGLVALVSIGRGKVFLAQVAGNEMGMRVKRGLGACRTASIRCQIEAIRDGFEGM
jgi:hypothetical protein